MRTTRLVADGLRSPDPLSTVDPRLVSVDRLANKLTP
jgi:hypothetical protein